MQMGIRRGPSTCKRSLWRDFNHKDCIQYDRHCPGQYQREQSGRLQGLDNSLIKGVQCMHHFCAREGFRGALQLQAGARLQLLTFACPMQ